MKKVIIILAFTILMFTFGGIALATLDQGVLKQTMNSVETWNQNEIFEKFSDTYLSESVEIVEQTEGIARIQFFGINSNVTIIGEEREGVLVWYKVGKSNSSPPFRIERTGDRLIIKEDKNRGITFGRTEEVFLYVPLSYTGHVEVETTNGMINGKNLPFPMTVNTTNAMIDLECTKEADLLIKTVNGMVDVTFDEKPDARLYLEVTNGVIHVNGEETAFLFGGKVHEETVGAGTNKVKIHNTNGEIDVRWEDKNAQ